MGTTKYKKLYLRINIPIMLIFFLLIIAPFFVKDRGNTVYYIGIVARIIMGIWITFNGLWNACTNYFSILNLSKNQNDRESHKWVWWIFVLLGIGCIITAFMGYGFNGVRKL
jgi:hypothetical protein